MQDQTKFTNYMVVLTDEDRQITHLFQFSERREKKKMEVFRCYIQVQLHKIYIGSLPSQKNHLSLSLSPISIF